MGKSVERDGLFGKYTEIYDDDGNKIAESREVDGFLGKYTEYTNTSGDKIGESREMDGFLGDYTEYTNTSGDKIGESREMDGFLGDYTEYDGLPLFPNKKKIENKELAVQDKETYSGSSSANWFEGFATDSTDLVRPGTKPKAGLGIMGVILTILFLLAVIGFYNIKQEKHQAMVSQYREVAAESIQVKPPLLPKTISSFMNSHRLKIPNTISNNCGFDFKSGNNPYFIKSDFDGDGAIDYAVDVLDKKDGYKILVFLAKGDIINLGGWEFIELDKSRGPFSDIAEKETTLENDSIAGIRCESSSVILVYNRTTNGFDEFWTGD